MKSYDPGGNGVFKEKERQAPLATNLLSVIMLGLSMEKKNVNVMFVMIFCQPLQFHEYVPPLYIKIKSI